MIQQAAKPFHDRQTEAQTAVPLARLVTDLMMIVEHRLQLAARDTDAYVPDLDLKSAAAPAAPE